MCDICIDDFPILMEHMSTLKETSFDDTNHIDIVQ